MAKAKKPKIKGEKVMRMVEFKLTDAQKAEKAQKAAEMSNELSEIVVEKKLAVDVFNSKIKDRTSRMNTLLGEVHRGVEEREVECIQVKNFETERVEYYHDGVKVQEREMNESDKQLSLAEAKKNAGKKWQKPKKETPDADGPDYIAPERAEDASKEAAKKRAEIRAVHREETGRNTAYSQLNGVRA